MSEQSGSIGLDELVSLSEVIASVIGRPLMPQESSRLKTTYRQAQQQTGPHVTLNDLARVGDR